MRTSGTGGQGPPQVGDHVPRDPRRRRDVRRRGDPRRRADVAAVPRGQGRHDAGKEGDAHGRRGRPARATGRDRHHAGGQARRAARGDRAGPDEPLRRGLRGHLRVLARDHGHGDRGVPQLPRRRAGGRGRRRRKEPLAEQARAHGGGHRPPQDHLHERRSFRGSQLVARRQAPSLQPGGPDLQARARLEQAGAARHRQRHRQQQRPRPLLRRQVARAVQLHSAGGAQAGLAGLRRERDGRGAAQGHRRGAELLARVVARRQDAGLLRRARRQLRRLRDPGRGGQERRLTTDPGLDDGPEFSPDGATSTSTRRARAA